MPSSSDSSSNLLGSFFKGGAGDFSVSLICCFTSICPLINKIIINMAIQIFFFLSKNLFCKRSFYLGRFWCLSARSLWRQGRRIPTSQLFSLGKVSATSVGSITTWATVGMRRWFPLAGWRGSRRRTSASMWFHRHWSDSFGLGTCLNWWTAMWTKKSVNFYRQDIKITQFEEIVYRFFDAGTSVTLRCFSDVLRDDECDGIEEIAADPEDFLCFVTDCVGRAVLWLLLPCSELLCFRTDCCFLTRFAFTNFECELDRELALLDRLVELEYELELELDVEDEEENEDPEE